MTEVTATAPLYLRIENGNTTGITEKFPHRYDQLRPGGEMRAMCLVTPGTQQEPDCYRFALLQCLDTGQRTHSLCHVLQAEPGRYRTVGLGE